MQRTMGRGPDVGLSARTCWPGRYVRGMDMQTDDRVRDYLNKRSSEFEGQLQALGYVPRRLYPEGKDPARMRIEERYGTLEPNAPRSMGDDELGSRPRLVVLGNAGAGKSLVMRRGFVTLAATWLSGGSEMVPLWLDLSRLGSNSDITETLDLRTNGLWRELTSDAPAHVALMVDGLDELIVRDTPRFPNDLWQFLQGQCGHIGCVQIACRRSVWDPGIVANLEPAFAPYSVDYLEPESYAHVIQDEAQLTRFFGECQELGVDALLGNPFDGFYLARRFAEGEELPHTRGEALDARVSDALEYTSERAARRCPVADLRRAACDIAAVATFCGVAAWTAENALDWLGALPTSVLTLDDIQWLLGLPLFVREGDHFRFVHELVREWLASEAIKGLTLRKQRQLLQTTRPGFDEVAPRFRGVASFLAEQDAGFRDHLVRADPLTAFMADTGTLAQERREELLNRVVQDSIRDGRAPFWAANNRGEEPRDALARHCPGDVAGFVLPLLQSDDNIARWWGIEAVKAWGAPRETLEDLCSIAADLAIEGSMREHATSAVTESGDPDAIRALYPLLQTGDDYVRGPVLEAYRVLDNPTPSEYIAMLSGGARNENLLSLLKLHVSRYGHQLDAPQLAEAFQYTADHLSDVGDLLSSLLWGLLERASELGFAQLPPELVTRVWAAAGREGGSHGYEDQLDALVRDHADLFDDVFRHALELAAAGATEERLWQASQKLGALATDHVFELLAPCPDELTEPETRFCRGVVGALWAKEPTAERLEHLRRLVPAWAAGLQLPRPRREPPPRDRLADRQQVVDLMNARPDRPSHVAWNTIVGVMRVTDQPDHQLPSPQVVLSTLDIVGPVIHHRALSAFEDCVLSLSYARTDQANGQHTFTHLLYALVFRVVGLAGGDLPSAKVAEFLRCYGFDGLEDAGDADENLALLGELRAADPALWEDTVRQLLEGHRIGSYRLAEHLRTTGNDMYVGRCAERLRTGDFDLLDLDWLLQYLCHFKPQDYGQILHDCYLLLRREFASPNGTDAARPTDEDAPTIAQHATHFNYWWQFGPLFLLMTDDDNWAWDEFAARLAEGDVPLDDDQRAFNSKWQPLSGLTSTRCGILADWYAAIRRDTAGDDLFHHDWAELVMGAIREIGGQSAIAELERLRRDNAFPGAEWLSHEIIELRGAMLDDASTPPSPECLLASIHNAHSYLVTGARNLMEVVRAAIEELSRELKAGEGVAGYWDGKKPKAEPLCQNVLWPALREKLRNWGLAVQEERPVAANRCDWCVELPRTGGASPLRVVLELKVARENYGTTQLIKPIHGQLFEKYMAHLGLSFGIYIVLWFRDQGRYDYPVAWPAADDLRAAVVAECERVCSDEGITVVGYVLDMTAPVRSR